MSAAAAKYDTGQQLATAWDEMWRRALELAATAGVPPPAVTGRWAVARRPR